MALPMLVGGSECGPSNPLQSLSKRFEQERGLQQDYFGASRAGSSREVFRSQNANAAVADQDAARFFSANNAPMPQLASEHPFDVSAMRAALPPHQGPLLHTQRMQQQNNAPSAWAADFIQHQPMTSASLVNAGFSQEHQGLQQQTHVQTAAASSAGLQHSPVPWNPAISAFRMNTMPAFVPHLHAQAPPTLTTSKRISWDREFNAQELSLASPPSAMEGVVQNQPQQEESSARSQYEGDELARTAGLLLEHVQHEQNPKFQKSQFLGLMKQLRDGEVIVEGNKMVESDGTRTSSSTNADVKGKGRAIDPVASFNASQAGKPAQSVHPPQLNGQVAQAENSDILETEDPNDAYFRQENAEFIKYWNESRDTQRGPQETPDTVSWDRLQDDWERFEAMSAGIKPVSVYQFQHSNPYLFGESSQTRHHLAHSGGRQSVLENVLELEAAVQRDMSNAGIWYELGVRQQENEREHKALQALQRAVELEPNLLPAWLALAISYTNDNNRQGTHDAISEWVNRNDAYRDAVQQFRATTPRKENMTMPEHFSYLIQCLIAMARSNLSSEVDADIQIALAVLLNTSEEYEKAQDCFRTALAVRPDDWLLYNRVGATMANSGRAEEALQFYYKALELNPGYIRARFNLGISCINLRRYEEAAQHILDALLLQESDATDDISGSAGKREVISTALWDSLKTACLQMQRADLATLCDLKDLDGIRKRFYG